MSARPAKRLKTCQPIDSDRPSRSNHRLLASRSEPRGSHEDALDSEDEIECQYEKEEKTITDLEKTLPPLEEDPEAIAAYERSGPATDDVAGLATASLGDGVHHKWRSSIYVDAFNLALETVLQDESFLFNDAELAVFEHWKGLSYDAQYL
jgi:Fanconi-associated nuclease 1